MEKKIVWHQWASVTGLLHRGVLLVLTVNMDLSFHEILRIWYCFTFQKDKPDDGGNEQVRNNPTSGTDGEVGFCEAIPQNVAYTHISS